MPQKFCLSESTYWQNYGVKKTGDTLRMLRIRGIPPTGAPYLNLERFGGELYAQIGFKVPKPITLIFRLFGLSPGEIKLWFDAESGWLSEARIEPGASPIYHYISDDQAVAILKEEVTPELHDYLMTPDDYLGE